MRRVAAAGAAATLAGLAHAQELLGPLPSSEERGVDLLVVLGLASLLLSAVAAIRVRPRDVPFGVASVGGALVVLASLLAFACMYALVRPKAGYEGLFAFVVLYFGAIPFILTLLGVWASVWSGNTTRFRLFAAWLGTLVAASTITMFVVANPS